MDKGRRKIPEINSSSTADIAFLLLIFFIITTSMNPERGLFRRLPPFLDENPQSLDLKIKERNVLNVYINSEDQLMCGKYNIGMNQLRQRAKEFIANPRNKKDLPEKHAKDIPFFGNVMITDNHVISLQNDRETNYQAYIDVQNELVAAYNELRNELAQEKWQKDYSQLNEEQQKAVREYYPMRISEAEPKKYGGNQ